MGEERPVILWGFIGAPNSGKSHQQRIVLQSLKRRRNLVIPDGRDDRMWNRLPELRPVNAFVKDPRDYKGKRMLHRLNFPDIRKFTGARTIFNDAPGTNSETMRAVLDPSTGFREGALVLDDIRNHIPSKSDLPGYVNSYFGSRRKLMVDILFAGWSLEDVNRQILALNPRLYIFNLTVTPTTTSLEKNMDPDRLIRTIEYVRQMNAKLPENQRHFFWGFDPGNPSYCPLPHGQGRPQQRPAPAGAVASNASRSSGDRTAPAPASGTGKPTAAPIERRQG